MIAASTNWIDLSGQGKRFTDVSFGGGGKRLSRLLPKTKDNVLQPLSVTPAKGETPVSA